MADPGKGPGEPRPLLFLDRNLMNLVEVIMSSILLTRTTTTTILYSSLYRNKTESGT